MLPKIQFVPRRSNERGQADHGWLKTFHTFSFAMYQDGRHMQFGPLRVLNEDRVAPGTGFGQHSHQEYEIFSYIISGQVEHKDSLGNTEVLGRGHLQLTSTGTGISHSEKTHGKDPAYFLQIWSTPAQRGLQPRYYTRWFNDEAKRVGWVRVVAPAWEKDADLRRDGVREGIREEDAKSSVEEPDTPAPVQSALSLYATMLSAPSSPSQSDPANPSTSTSTREITLKGSKAYVHLPQTSGYNPGQPSGATVRITEVGQHAGSGLELREGDGAYIQVLNALRGCPGESHEAKLRVENVGGGGPEAEILVFDLD